MNKPTLCLILAICLSGSAAAQAPQQPPQEETIVLGQTNTLRIAWAEGQVVVLAAQITNSSGDTVYTTIDYASGQSWYMNIIYANLGSTSKTVKLEYILRYSDGAGYYAYRTSKVIAASTVLQTRIKVTSYIAKLGLITLTGRVYGTGMGNNNLVTSQVYVF